MADENDNPADWEGPHLHCQLFVPCHTVWYDVDRPERGYSLGRVVLEVWPGENGYPIGFGRLFGYMHLQGDDGDYSVRVRLLRVAFDEDGDSEYVPIGENGLHVEFGPWPVELLAVDFVNEYFFPMHNVVFTQPGLYGLELLQDIEGGEPKTLSRVHIFARARNE